MGKQVTNIDATLHNKIPQAAKVSKLLLVNANFSLNSKGKYIAIPVKLAYRHMRMSSLMSEYSPYISLSEPKYIPPDS